MSCRKAVCEVCLYHAVIRQATHRWWSKHYNRGLDVCRDHFDLLRDRPHLENAVRVLLALGIPRESDQRKRLPLSGKEDVLNREMRRKSSELRDCFASDEDMREWIRRTLVHLGKRTKEWAAANRRRWNEKPDLATRPINWR